MNLKLVSSSFPKRTNFLMSVPLVKVTSHLWLWQPLRPLSPIFHEDIQFLLLKNPILRIWLRNSVKFYSYFIMSCEGGWSSDGQSTITKRMHQLLWWYSSWRNSKFSIFTLSGSNRSCQMNNDNAAKNMNRLVSKLHGSVEFKYLKVIFKITSERILTYKCFSSCLYSWY